MRILILGAGGQLGAEITDLLPPSGDVTALKHQELDVCDHTKVTACLEELSPNVVINTTAYNRVDAAESEPEQAMRVNALALLNLAASSHRLGAKLVHFSTDYVFDGQTAVPHTEGSPTNPVSVYGLSKLAGELFVRNYCTNHLLIRTAGLYGNLGRGGKGGNFVETMLQLGYAGKQVRVVNDQELTPTSTRDLAPKVLELIDAGATGLLHVTNGGSCTWYQFASAIFRHAGLAVDVCPITSEEYGAAARRPRYSVLAHAGLRSLGVQSLRNWDEALGDYLHHRRTP